MDVKVCKETHGDLFLGTHVLEKPVCSKLSHLSEGAGLLKKVGRSRYDDHVFLTLEILKGFPVHGNNRPVVAPDDKQGRRLDLLKKTHGKVRAASP